MRSWFRSRAWVAALVIGLPAGGMVLGLTVLHDVSGSDPRRGDIDHAVAQGWFLGYPDGSFRPDQTISEDQLARVIRRLRPDLSRADAAVFVRGGVDRLRTTGITAAAATTTTAARPGRPAGGRRVNPNPPAVNATAAAATAPADTATTTTIPAAATTTAAGSDGTPLSSYVERGGYAVGLREVYFHDPARPFDGWNAVHASAGYQAVLKEINDAGETQIVAAHMWYPADEPGAARPADGRFPVIVAAHGLGGFSLQWTGFAEYLASHGYAVVAPSFISDSSAPNVFKSPDSEYAQSSTAAAVNRAYRTITGESKVIPGFYKYLFRGGQSELSAAPGGPRKVGEMMGGFFTQRVADVETVIDGLHSLDKDEDTCASEYTARGQPLHGAAVCGLFTGALDVENIGVMGHSLGSMTAQFAVASSQRVDAAVGYNNGPPRYWEPPGIFGDGEAADGQPAGSSGPVMQIHGSEDAFVQGVFRGLMWNTYLTAGGDPDEIWLLEQERVLPTDENPQPIARNAYNRATGDKVIISVKDLDHDSLLTNGGAARSAAPTGVRKAVGQDVLDPGFRGEPYLRLAWGTVGGADVYLPAFIRNYYTKNWFDYYLKGDSSAIRFTENPIQDQGLVDIRSSISGG